MSEIEISVVEARELTDRIKRQVSDLWGLIVRAYESRTWAVLGYESWDEYCEVEFEASRIRVPREDRKEIVCSLRDRGLSTRAIASATGVGPTTVRRELAGAPNGAPEQPKVKGVDGKTYQVGRPTPPTPKPDLHAVPDPQPQPQPAETTPNEPTTPKAAEEHTPYRFPERERLGEREDDYVTTLAIQIRKAERALDIRTAERALDEAIEVARRMRSWPGESVSGDIRGRLSEFERKLDELDDTLANGGIDGEFQKLLESER